jgi:hypothetical protein
MRAFVSHFGTPALAAFCAASAGQIGGFSD